jgi:hypothetical protein
VLQDMEVAMTTIARMLSSQVPAAEAQFEALKAVGMFCAVGLSVSLLLASYGVDLSPGFF